jgi:hypothetical protein
MSVGSEQDILRDRDGRRSFSVNTTGHLSKHTPEVEFTVKLNPGLDLELSQDFSIIKSRTFLLQVEDFLKQFLPRLRIKYGVKILKGPSLLNSSYQIH